MRHTCFGVTVKRRLKSVYNYGSYRKIKTGVPLFGPLCIVHRAVIMIVNVAGGSVTASSPIVRSVVVGLTASFYCTSDADGEFRWYYCTQGCSKPTALYNGEKLGPSVSSRISVNSTLRQSQLTITSVQLGDAGRYSCSPANAIADQLHFVLTVYRKSYCLL